MNTKVAGALAWIGLTVGAFAVNVETGLVFVIGQVGQWFLNAPKGVPTAVAVSAMLAMGLGGFAVIHNPPLGVEYRSLLYPWIIEAFKWSLMIYGVASIAGKTKGAPATDSLDKMPVFGGK